MGSLMPDADGQHAPLLTGASAAGTVLFLRWTVTELGL